MSTPVWCEYVCDDCCRTASGMWSSNARVPVKALKSQAISEGFVFAEGECLCKECKQDRVAKSAEGKS